VEVVALDLPGSEGKIGSDSPLHFAAADILDESAVSEAIELAVSLAPLRVLVNCAGMGTPARIVKNGEPVPLEHFRRIIDVNLTGTFNVIRLTAAAMQKSTEPVDGERGVIINTASVAAFEGQIGQAAYAASKGGLLALTITAARDLAGSLIRCVTIAPGQFDTPLFATLSPEVREALANAIPHPRRLGKVEEYAQLVESIIGNPMLNGETIRLDGAIRMAPR
jgi:NAD(P)-dependent dehydrogenase (short-subunit alcohol dehydrogenase family)